MNYLKKYFEIYKNTWNVDSTQEPIYLMTRDHAGSYVALILSIYNIFLIKQTILKNAIHITKSKNPKVIKLASSLVGCFYFMGLYLLWNIPSFFTQIAVRSYCASQTAMTNLLVEQNLKQEIFADNRLQNILKKEGLKLCL